MSVPVLPFVDAHHHLWDTVTHQYDWLSGDGWPEETAVIGAYAPIRGPYLAKDLLRDAAGTGLTKSVHVQADWSGPDPVDETVWLEEENRRTGLPTAIVAHVALASETAEVDIDRHRAYPSVRGIRSTPNELAPDDLAFRRGMGALERAGLSYDLRLTPDNAPACAGLIEAFPNVLFIVGHTGEPLGRDAAARSAWTQAMRLAAPSPNVVVKISGLGMRDHRWTVDSIRPWILDTIALFGPERCMFGTNWPVDRLYSSYATLVSAYRAIIADLSTTEQAALLAHTAERVYRI